MWKSVPITNSLHGSRKLHDPCSKHLTMYNSHEKEVNYLFTLDSLTLPGMNHYCPRPITTFFLDLQLSVAKAKFLTKSYIG